MHVALQTSFFDEQVNHGISSHITYNLHIFGHYAFSHQ
jgi:hypothetical protein